MKHAAPLPPATHPSPESEAPPAPPASPAPPAPPASASEGKPEDVSVYTFGFGEDHDAELLKKISDAGNGMYYFIETEDKVGFLIFCSQYFFLHFFRERHQGRHQLWLLYANYYQLNLNSLG